MLPTKYFRRSFYIFYRFLEKKYGETSAELLATLGELSTRALILHGKDKDGGIIGRIPQTLISAIYQAIIQSSSYAQTDTCPVSAFTVKFQLGASLSGSSRKHCDVGYVCLPNGELNRSIMPFA